MNTTCEKTIENQVLQKRISFQILFINMIEVEGLKEANNNYQDKPRFKY